MALTGPAQAQDWRLSSIGPGTYGGLGVRDAIVLGNDLIIAGSFSSFNGHARRNIVGWDGATGYSDIPGAFEDLSERVNDLMIYNGFLLAAGWTNGAGGVFAWDGMMWTSFGGSFNAQVTCLAVHNGELYSGGDFTMCGGSPLDRVARWDGVAWVMVGDGLPDDVRALASHDGQLYAGGDFEPTILDPGIPEHLACWNGSSWQQVLDGLSDDVTHLLSSFDGLWIGGAFSWSGDSTVALDRIALFNGSAFAPHPLPWRFGESVHGLFHDQGDNVVISTSERAFIHAGGVWTSNFWDLARGLVDFQGAHYLFGRFNRDECAAFRGVAKILQGMDLAWLRPNDLGGLITPAGRLFCDGHSGEPGLEAPSGSGRFALFDHELMLSSQVDDSLFVTPAPIWGTAAPDPASGPWGTVMDDVFCDRFRQVWPVDIGTIWDHASNWDQPGYVMSYVIENWPGNGNTSNGEPLILAPFRDLDADSLYEPQQGEFPLIKGDDAVYYVMNDRNLADWSNSSDQVGVEIRLMTHGQHYTGNDAVDNTLITNYNIINRSAQHYDTLYIGSFESSMIGCEWDNYVGCDTMLNMGYTFNGDAYDETTAGYGDHPPALGIVALNADLHAFFNLTGGGSYSIPFTDQGFHNYLRGRKVDGSEVIDPFTLQPTRYMYHGDPVIGTGWTEAADSNAADSRHFLLSFGPFLDIGPGDTICLDLAFVFAQDTAGDNISSVALLKQRTQELKDWYDAQAQPCTEFPTLGVPSSASIHEPWLSLEPNPTSDRIMINVSAIEAPVTLELFNSSGSLVRRIEDVQGSLSLSLNGLDEGMYVVNARNALGSRSARFVKIND